MTWLPASIGSRIDDARRRLEAAEADARAFAARAKATAVDAIARDHAAAPSRTREAPREAPDPPAAVLEQTARAAAEFAKVKAAEARTALPAGVLPSLPTPSPAVGETGSAMEEARPYVMVAGGFVSGVVTGKLGPAGAIAQRVADAAVDRYGTAEDKFNFGYGQLGAAVVVGVQGATMMGEGGAAETATLGAATPIAVPVAVAGAVQVAVAASHVDGAIGLMSKGAPSSPEPATGRVYEPSPKHGKEKVGNVSAAPKNGQAALDNSVQVKETSTRRVGVDRSTGDFVIFDETHPGKGVFHGHVRSWDELTDQQRNACIRGGLTDQRGRILGGAP